MNFAQDRYPNDLQEMVDWIAKACPPSGRILEIGCGDGAVTNQLVAMGFDVIGVDPAAEATANIQSVAFEDVEAPPFDVLFASVSLHHLPDPMRATEALQRLSKPGSMLLVREFDRTMVLEHRATMEWWFHQRQAKLAITPLGEVIDDTASHFHALGEFDAFAVNVRQMLEHHVLPWSVVAEFLSNAGFTTEEQSTTPYLYRWELDEALRSLEEELIERGHIKAIGIQWAGRRTA